MSGNHAFRLDPGSELVPLVDSSAMLPERATVAKTAKTLGITPHAVRRIAKAYEKGG